MITCPMCDCPLDQPAPDWQQREYVPYHFGPVTQAVAPGCEYERRKPARSAAVLSDVAVPGLQSLISGIVAGISCGGVAAVLNVQGPALIGLACGCAICAAAWFMLLRSHRALLWEVERVIGADLNGNGTIGRPEETTPAREPVKVEIVDRARQSIRYVDVPLSDAELERLARACLIREVEFSRRKLQEADALTPERYGPVVEALLRGGLLRYKGRGDNAGVELTPSGRAFLRQYLSPTPQEVVVGGGGWRMATVISGVAAVG